MNKLNEISLSQTMSYYVPRGDANNKSATIALMAEVATLGFSFDKKMINVLQTLSKPKLKVVRKELMEKLHIKVGSHVNHVPLFINFPDDVPDQYEYLFKRMIGYIDRLWLSSEVSENFEELACGCKVDPDLFDLSLFGACPICQMAKNNDLSLAPRKVLKDRPKYKKIKLISEEGQLELVKNLIGSRVSYSPEMKDDIVKAMDFLGLEVLSLIPETFIVKENLAFMMASILKRDILKKEYKIDNHFKTATDVLRLATALSSGDVSLKEETKYKMTNSERNTILRLLNNPSNSLEDLLRYRMKWLRLADYLHVGAFAKKYPEAAKKIDILRNNEKSIETFSKELHKGILEYKVTSKNANLLNLLQKRPGEFARKIDLLLRINSEDVLETFKSVIGDVSTTILLKLGKYISTRNERNSFRAFLPKGNMAKIHVKLVDNRSTIEKDVILKFKKMIDKELASRYSKKTSLANVYIDPALKNVLVPLVLRNATKNLMTLTRGSRITLDKNTKFIRTFIYWKESEESDRVDLDLSVAGFDENMNNKMSVSFRNLSFGKDAVCVHSGDIQAAPEGASEFIDFKIQDLLDVGVKYLHVGVIGYTGQKLNTFECFSGFMERQHLGSGEIFEPRTVQNKFDLNTDSTSSMPMMFDLETNELIWCDLDATSGKYQTIENNTPQMVNMAKAILDMKNTSPNLFDLFSLQAKARGATIHNVKVSGVKYDEVFDLEFSKDIANIATNWIE